MASHSAKLFDIIYDGEKRNNHTSHYTSAQIINVFQCITRCDYIGEAAEALFLVENLFGEVMVIELLPVNAGNEPVKFVPGE